MIKAHEQQIDLRLPRIATVRKGAPKPEKGPGRDLAYFRLDRADPAVVAAWQATYGPEPAALSGILPYADPAECLSIWDELWQGKRLLWRGDGERLHVQLQGNAYVRYAPGDGPAQPAAAGQRVGNGKVARLSRLRLLMPQLRIAGIVEVMSSSAIDADELWANLMWIKATVATLQGAPVTVFRAARQFNIPNPRGEGIITVEKHMLHMMLDGRYLDALLPVAGALPAPVAPAALPAPVGLAVNDDDDAPEEGDYDDEPAASPAATNANGAAPATANVQPATQPTPAAAPLPDDEQVIVEADPRQFLTVAAATLGTDADTVKARLHALGYTAIPGKPAARLDAYRRLRGDMGTADATLFDVAKVDVTKPGAEYQD